MELATFLDRPLMFCRMAGMSKKRLFEQIADEIAATDEAFNSKSIFEGLFTRERLGSTGLGGGKAIPHCRLDYAAPSRCALVTLDQPIDFEAPDGEPVDLLIFLVVSGEATQLHLDMLAAVASAFNDTDFCTQLRSATSADQLADLVRALEANPETLRSV